ncbi:hypothetical protein GCM10020255_048430 [Rhodococcus baikonurensis]
MLLPETPALLALRQAVRAWTVAYEPRRRVVVALSGGADSLALTAAAVAETDSVDALIVDHRLQDGSDAVARSAADQALALGCRTATVLTVDVADGGVSRPQRVRLDTALCATPGLTSRFYSDTRSTIKQRPSFSDYPAGPVGDRFRVWRHSTHPGDGRCSASVDR